jgi:putative ABC transport system permease protein
VNLSLALRNLSRRKSRTILTAVTIVIGILMMAMSIGYNRGVAKQMTDLVTYQFTGDLLVLAGDNPSYDIFKPAKPNAEVLTDIDRLISVLEQDNAVLAAAPRIRFGGLLQTADSDTNLLLYGVDPERESRFNPDFYPKTGQPFAAKSMDGILISDATAEQLGLKIGDTVRFVSPDRQGRIQEAQFTISGIFHSLAYTKGRAYISLEAAQKLLDLSNDEAQEAAVILRDRDTLDASLERLQVHLMSASSHVHIDAWDDRAGFFTGLIIGNGVSLAVMVGILFLAIVFGLMNTVVMMIKERTGEIGAMIAMGTPGSRVLGLLVLEQLVLVGLSSVVGLVISFGLIRWLNRVGIPAPNAAMEYAFAGQSLHPVIAPEHLALALFVALLFALLATLVSGFGIIRMKPIDALRDLT